MPNISQVEVNGTTYDICDAAARDDITTARNDIDARGHIAVIGGTSASTNFTGTATNLKVPFADFYQTPGSESIFSENNSGIHISTAGWFLASASIQLGASFNDQDIIHLHIKRTQGDDVGYTQLRCAAAACWSTLSVPPVLFYSESADWNIWAEAQNQTAARGYIGQYNSARNYLMIMKVK